MLSKNKFLRHKNKQFIGLIISSLFLIACSKNSDGDQPCLKYIAVQIEEGDYWSIMDCNGKIIVKEEYSPDNVISPISQEGVYWVKSGIDGKFRLYSIDSPKTPITPKEYTAVTTFTDGKAFVNDGENPIQVINLEGKVENTLSTDIRRVWVGGIQIYYSVVSDRIIYADKNRKWGYLDTNGHIAIEAQYDEVFPFNDNVALVRKTKKDDKLYIIEKNGKEKGAVDLGRYDVYTSIIPPFFSEDKLAVTAKANDDRLLYLGKDGKVLLELPPKYNGCHHAAGSNFHEGYAVVEDKKDNFGVINEDGECIIRLGKYESIFNLKNKTFLVQKKDEFGIIDAEDNSIVDVNYDDGVYTIMLDENYIMKNGSDWLLVKPNGEEINNSRFHGIGFSPLTEIRFHDMKSIAEDLVAQIETKGYTPIAGKQNIKDITKTLHLKEEDQKLGTIYIEMPSFKSDVYDVEVGLGFDERTLSEKTHIEVVNDGWFSHEKTVSDGWHWNENAMLDHIHLRIDNIHEDINMENLSETIFQTLKKKGFEYAADGYYEAKNGDKFAGVSIETIDRGITLWFYPYKEYSKNSVDLY